MSKADPSLSQKWQSNLLWCRLERNATAPCSMASPLDGTSDARSAVGRSPVEMRQAFGETVGWRSDPGLPYPPPRFAMRLLGCFNPQPTYSVSSPQTFMMLSGGLQEDGLLRPATPVL